MIGPENVARTVDEIDVVARGKSGHGRGLGVCGDRCNAVEARFRRNGAAFERFDAG
jgi:hypothetical protein